MTTKYRITMTAEQVAKLRDLARDGAPDIAAAFDRVLGSGAGEPAPEDADPETNDEDGDAPAPSGAEARAGFDDDDDLAGDHLRARLEDHLDGEGERTKLDPIAVDPERAVAAMTASAKRSEDEPLPRGRAKGRRSPLAIWASSSRDEEQPNDGHPARAARGRR